MTVIKKKSQRAVGISKSRTPGGTLRGRIDTTDDVLEQMKLRDLDITLDQLKEGKYRKFLYDPAAKLRANHFEGGRATIGDGTNYLEIEDDGTIHMIGDATVWDDFVVELSTAKVPPANAPNWAQVTDDGSGSTGVFAWHFANGEYLSFHIQMPHSWKEGSRIYPHIHFECTTDVDPAEKFDIDFEYFWVDVGKDRPANTILANRMCDTGVDTDTKHQVADVPELGIDGTGHTISSILICRLERIAAASNDYGGQVIIYDMDVHFEKDTIGSREIWTKDNT
jgi:hypothetical protein